MPIKFNAILRVCGILFPLGVIVMNRKLLAPLLLRLVPRRFYQKSIVLKDSVGDGADQQQLAQSPNKNVSSKMHVKDLNESPKKLENLRTTVNKDHDDNKLKELPNDTDGNGRNNFPKHPEDLRAPVNKVDNHKPKELPNGKVDIARKDSPNDSKVLRAPFNKDDDDGYKLEELPNLSFKLTMHVAPAFYGGLIGAKGNTKRRLEQETNTKIIIPPRKKSRTDSGQNSEHLIITGKSRDDVCEAWRNIKLMIPSLLEQMRPTHFLCVPLNSGEIKENYIAFKKQVLDGNFPGVAQDFFTSEHRIHLTLGVCLLLDDADRVKGIEQLEKCREFLADLKVPFEIKVSGLETFNNNPNSVRVLYARVEAPEVQKFADRALGPFRESGLNGGGKRDRNRDSVKLHMTLIKVKFRKDKKPKSFDASEILKRFGDFHFGSAQVNEVQLCVIQSGEGEGFYDKTGSISF